MSIESMLEGKGLAVVGFVGAVSLGGAAMGGALGSLLVTNMSAGAGALIGVAAATAELVAGIALRLFGCNSEGFAKYIPNALLVAVANVALITAFPESGLLSRMGMIFAVSTGQAICAFCTAGIVSAFSSSEENVCNA